MNNTTATNNAAAHTGHGPDPVTSGHAGSSVGNRVKGAFEVLHGAGESIRGTAMGALDTMGHEGLTKNDEIARQGRLEMERGLANLKGSKAVSQTGYGTTGTGTENTTGAYGSHTQPSTTTGGYTGGAGAGLNDSHGLSGGTGAGMGHGIAGSDHTTYPSHHRDDAVANVPTPELRDAQAQYQHQQENRPGAALGTGGSAVPHTTDSSAKYDQNQQTGFGGGADQFGKEAGYAAGGNVRSTGAPGMLN
ncbi:hypothetical protein CPC08DRAFT_707318 [Agrocybe pediades]|nr:hypothetical protein CPC08DRAFT_707318 [Agrocybe pediades]